MVTSRPPCSRKEIAASIFGPILPGRKWPSARYCFAADTVRRSKSCSSGEPNYNFACSTDVRSTIRSTPIAQASTLEVWSLSITASTLSRVPSVEGNTPRKSKVLADLAVLPDHGDAAGIVAVAGAGGADDLFVGHVRSVFCKVGLAARGFGISCRRRLCWRSCCAGISAGPPPCRRCW